MQVINMTLKLHVKLTEFNFMNPQAEYYVVRVDHDPLGQVTDASSKSLIEEAPILKEISNTNSSAEKLGGTVSSRLERKNEVDCDSKEDN
ncbi:unnamed protein product [Linum tenue]|uniref:Uncharacterized protein n=1 Tax=Linum tenue TaxID=586396 RepID=A0AAV0LLW2_9ROSI|nr:unnamed protein product [Linum tenue]